MIIAELILRRVAEGGRNLLRYKAVMQNIAGLTKVSITTYNPQRPKGDMLKYQSSLPKLPVPPLQQSLQKYLKAVRPLVNDEEFEKTSKAVREFGKNDGIGIKLQKELEERARTHDNWLADWWLHVAYLSYRDSSVINSNPGSIFMCPFINEQSYIHYAMRIIVSMEKFHLLIKSENLQVERNKAGPLCMSQYFNLFSCCRIPGKEVADTLRRTPLEESRHIIVAHNDHFFSLEVLSLLPDGSYTLVPAQHIEEQLHKIVESSRTKAQHPVGVLTTEHRDTWYHARERLLTDPVNKITLDVIERAQFVLCLDPAHPGMEIKSSITAEQLGIISSRNLHGNGSKYCTCSRWFDHAIQTFVNPTGYSGFNLEHGAADGTVAIQINVYNIANLQSEDFLNYKSPVPAEQLVSAQQLQWNISPESAQDIEEAKIKIDSAVADCDLQTFIFEDFGKDLIKSCNLSPDSFIQVAIQLAYYRMYGHLAATYESAATRQFLLGRTDTIRACSVESLSFCKAISDPIVTTEQKVAKLRVAIEAHRKYALEAVSGNAFDRHLLGLKILATSAGIQMPSIFTDQSFAKCLHMCLSTSQVPSENTMLPSFGPVVPDGYGICYNPQKIRMLFAISSFKKCHETSTTKFATNLFEAMKQMKIILESQSSTAKL